MLEIFQIKLKRKKYQMEQMENIMNKLNLINYKKFKNYLKGVEINIKHFIILCNVKGSCKDINGKPYHNRKAHSVTVLNNPKNRTKKNHQDLQVFRKGKE